MGEPNSRKFTQHDRIHNRLSHATVTYNSTMGFFFHQFIWENIFCKIACMQGSFKINNNNNKKKTPALTERWLMH